MQPPSSTAPLAGGPRRGRRHLVCWILLGSVLGGPPAAAVTLLGFDNARPVAPGTVRAGPGVAGGDGILTGWAHGRLGVLEEIDLALRAGAVSLEGPSDAETGVEIEAEYRMRFLRTADTGLVDLAFVGAGSIVRTDRLTLIGLDPQLYASRHFAIGASARELYLALGLGLAVTWESFDAPGATSDWDHGLATSIGAGIDLVESVQLNLEGRIRDEYDRIGLAVTWTFH